MKSPEQFDFSKLKDQKKFDKLPKNAAINPFMTSGSKLKVT